MKSMAFSNKVTLAVIVVLDLGVGEPAQNNVRRPLRTVERGKFVAILVDARLAFTHRSAMRIVHGADAVTVA